MTHFKSKASYLKNYEIKLVVENKLPISSLGCISTFLIQLSGYFLPFNI